MTRQPNILLIMTDQQRADSMGYVRGAPSDTPNLDALARRGVIFDNAYSSSPSCVPARTSLMTGLLHHRAPLVEPRPTAQTRIGLALQEGYWTIAHALRDAGYDTALFGKMHFQPIRAEHGFGLMRTCEHLPAGYPKDAADDYREELEAAGLKDLRFQKPSTPRVFPYDIEFHPTRWVTRHCLDFLGRPERAERPWFAVASFPDPHTPYLPPEPYSRMYPPEEEVIPDESVEVNSGLPSYLHDAAMINRPGAFFAPRRTDHLSPEQVRSVLAAIRAGIRQVDDSVAELLQQVDLNKTVVFFLSDHGDYGGHRGFLGKVPWIPFDDLAKVPFFAAGAGIAGGRRIESPVQSFDFVPTALDLAGIDAPADDLDSVSLLPVLEGGKEDRDRMVFCATTEGWPMLRRGSMKQIWHSGADTSALYNLAEDPGESVNLAGQPEHRELLRDNTAILRQLMNKPTPDIWRS